MKFKYTGNADRVFPSIGVTVKPGDEFEAPDNFVAVDVVSISGNKPSSPKPQKVKEEEEEIKSFVADKTEEEITTDMSALSDKTLGE